MQGIPELNGMNSELNDGQFGGASDSGMFNFAE
jgi:hypothetical protein